MKLDQITFRTTSLDHNVVKVSLVVDQMDVSQVTYCISSDLLFGSSIRVNSIKIEKENQENGYASLLMTMLLEMARQRKFALRINHIPSIDVLYGFYYPWIRGTLDPSGNHSQVVSGKFKTWMIDNNHEYSIFIPLDEIDWRPECLSQPDHDLKPGQSH